MPSYLLLRSSRRSLQFSLLAWPGSGQRATTRTTQSGSATSCDGRSGSKEALRNARSPRPSLSEARPYASCMELEVRPASEVERFVAFARANGCQCRVTFRDNLFTFDVPLARDPKEARRIALDVIARFSANNTGADVRVTRYD